jgi:TonB family protein
MRNLEFWILAYLVNSLWQVPLLFAAGWLAARALRSAGAEVEHRVWVVTLVLQSLLPAGSALSFDGWPTLAFLGWNANRAGEAQVSVVMGGGTGIGVLPSPGWLLAAIAISYVAVVTWYFARFLWRAINLPALRREAVPVRLTGEAALFWERCSKGLAGVSMAASSRIFSPVTMGLGRKLILLPARMGELLPAADIHTVIAHEFAHIHREDFLKNLLYQLLSLPVAYHPLLWLTQARIMESREMVCDQMATVMTGRDEYAQSLLRLASLLIAGKLQTTPHTIGIFDANLFERRLMNLTENPKNLQGAPRVAMVMACAVLGLATCGTALALGMHVDSAPASESSNATKTPKQLSVPSEVMSKNLLNKVVPKYPPAAKKAKIQGTVVLSAVIGKDGNIENLRVLSGPSELQQSALDAVRQWIYTPYLLNGDPIEVVTTVHVVYTLNG